MCIQRPGLPSIIDKPPGPRYKSMQVIEQGRFNCSDQFFSYC